MEGTIISNDVCCSYLTTGQSHNSGYITNRRPAPPALDAMITIPANIHKSSLSLVNLVNKADITIAVVRLSSAAEKRMINN